MYRVVQKKNLKNIQNNSVEIFKEKTLQHKYFTQEELNSNTKVSILKKTQTLKATMEHCINISWKHCLFRFFDRLGLSLALS